MKITPLEIHNHQFGTAFRGYDRDEVRSVLAMVSEEFEKAIAETTRMKDQMAELREQLNETRSREKSIQKALESADRISKEIKDTARRESEVLVQEARLKANKLLEQAEGRAQAVEDRITELKAMRQRLEHRMRTLLEEHVNTLDRNRREDADEEKLFLVQRQTTA